MKTKEIDVLIDKIVLNSNIISGFTSDSDLDFNSSKMLKAKLIIEVPEQKVVISESQAKDAVEHHFYKESDSLEVEAFLSELGFKNE